MPHLPTARALKRLVALTEALRAVIEADNPALRSAAHYLTHEIGELAADLENALLDTHELAKEEDH
jgi:uncharacterized protein YaaN involved in tellurite resistance